MEILILGVGGVGGYFGGKIAKAGYSVSLFARGKHMEAIREKGLEVKSVTGNFTVFPKIVTDDTEEFPKPDLVILGVKSWQISEAANVLKSVIKKSTIVLPLQNGANNVEELLKVLPERNVIAGLCRIVSFIDAPGRIKHVAFEPEIVFGEVDNSRSQRTQVLQEIFNRSEIKNSIPEDIQLEIWKKFLFIVTISGIGGLTRVSVGRMRDSEYLYGMMQKTANEILQVANAKNIKLTKEHVSKVFDNINNLPYETTASTQRDIMEAKPSELENFNGFIVKEGQRLGIETPANKLIYECLLPMEQKARKL